MGPAGGQGGRTGGGVLAGLVNLTAPDEEDPVLCQELGPSRTLSVRFPQTPGLLLEGRACLADAPRKPGPSAQCCWAAGGDARAVRSPQELSGRRTWVLGELHRPWHIS